MVGETGFEPATLCSQSRCATRLRHSPTGGAYQAIGVGATVYARYFLAVVVVVVFSVVTST